jgi:hypothetical protein
MPNERVYAICSPGDAPIAGLLFTAPDWIWSEPLTISSDGEFQSAYLAFLGQMAGTLPADATLWIVTHRSALSRARDWISNSAFSRSVRTIPVEDDCRFTVWARDLFLVTRSSAGLAALAPCEFPRADDERLASDVARGLDLPFVRSDLFFQGGNVVANDRVVMVGADDANMFLEWRSQRGAAITLADYARRLCPLQTCLVLGSSSWTCAETVEPLQEREGWRERRFPGSPLNSRQPVYHLDMFVAPLGKGRVAVGRTSLACEMAACAQADEGIDIALDEIAGALTNSGFEIVRAPLPILADDDAEFRLRTWYCASPLNAIADPWTGTVWLPRLAGADTDHELAAIDEFHAAMWRESGYRVIGLQGFDPIFRRLGGPRCLAQILPEY